MEVQIRQTETLKARRRQTQYNTNKKQYNRAQNRLGLTRAISQFFYIFVYYFIYYYFQKKRQEQQNKHSFGSHTHSDSNLYRREIQESYK